MVDNLSSNNNRQIRMLKKDRLRPRNKQKVKHLNNQIRISIKKVKAKDIMKILTPSPNQYLIKTTKKY